MTHRYFQPCDQANIGAGKEPDSSCLKCNGKGFFYAPMYHFLETETAFIRSIHSWWARTCSCKN
jgi:hypothetical protein